ncbi:glycerophosphodiester phosphodiesterase [Pseudobacteriovorax antillogorgiicola]|nr:glycerophosphodiester phosphodiesterase [Pseudobacteriovorax antillogorgiicola]
MKDDVINTTLGGCGMIVIGHRGAPDEALENSWDSFRKAIAGGAARIELDVHLGKEGLLPIIHDENLKRTTGHDIEVSVLSPKDLARIKLSNQEALPLLEDVLNQLLPQIELNIELKSGGKELADAVVTILPPLEARPRKIIISSFDRDLIYYLSQQHPQETLALLWDESDLSSVEAEMKRSQCRIFHPEVRYVNQELMSICQANEWLVFPYISMKDETDPETIWTQLEDLGVDGLCTNFPREMTQWLQGRS